MVAGPSEVTIVADKDSNASWIASDLIAQAEHDVFAQSILISNSKDLIKSVNIQLKMQLIKLPKKYSYEKFKKFGLAIYVSNQIKFKMLI